MCSISATFSPLYAFKGPPPSAVLDATKAALPWWLRSVVVSVIVYGLSMALCMQTRVPSALTGPPQAIATDGISARPRSSEDYKRAPVRSRTGARTASAVERGYQPWKITSGLLLPSSPPGGGGGGLSAFEADVASASSSGAGVSSGC